MRLPACCRVTFLSGVLLVLLPGPVLARMYQWVDAQTGTVQLSGAPPAWYRSSAPGPRVFVFEDGRLIDDTSRRLPAEETALLRATAFGAPLPRAPVLDADLFATPTVGIDVLPPQPAPTPDALPPPDDSTSRQIAEFKALLEAYDRAQEATAHHTLDTPTPAPHARLARPAPEPFLQQAPGAAGR